MHTVVSLPFCTQFHSDRRGQCTKTSATGSFSFSEIWRLKHKQSSLYESVYVGYQIAPTSDRTNTLGSNVSLAHTTREWKGQVYEGNPSQFKYSGGIYMIQSITQFGAACAFKACVSRKCHPWHLSFTSTASESMAFKAFIACEGTNAYFCWI